MDVKELYEKIIRCHDEMEVSKIVHAFLKAHPEAGFVALGTQVHEEQDNIGLSQVAGNQASDPLICFKELATNAFDAEIEHLASTHKVDLSSHSNPTQAWSAVLQAVASSGQELPADQIIAARAKDDKTGAVSLSLIDKGCGQPNHKVVGTFLSLSAGHKNKAGRGHNFGAHGQGSTGVHRHSMLGFKLIATGTGDGEWSLGIIRKRQGEGAFILEWLSLDPKARAVPSFKSESIHAAFTPDGRPWAGQNASAAPPRETGSDSEFEEDSDSAPSDQQSVNPSLTHGTVVKVFSFNGAGRANAEFPNDLIDPFLDELPHPICCVELVNKPKLDASKKNDRRAASAGSDVRFARGAKHRLRAGRKLPKGVSEDGLPPAGELARICRFDFQVDNPTYSLWKDGAIQLSPEKPVPTATVTVSAEARLIPATRRQRADKSVDWANRIQKFSKDRVFFSYFGQLHHTGVDTLDSNRFFKDSVQMPSAKDEVALFIDISSIGSDYFSNLFMASRDRVAKTPWYANLASSLRDAAMEQRENGLLGAWEEACKQRDRSNQNFGLLEEDNEGGYAAAKAFAKNRGFNALFKRMAKKLAGGNDGAPKNSTIAPAQGLALSAAEGGIGANVADQGSSAIASSISTKNSRVAGLSTPAKANTQKPTLEDPPAARKAAGKKHTIRIEKTEGASSGGGIPRSAPAARILNAESETSKGGKPVRKGIPAQDFRIEGQYLDEQGNCHYTIGIRKGSDTALIFDKEGACVVFTLQQDGRQEMVHAKVLWESKEALKPANPGPNRPLDPRDDPSQGVTVGLRMASSHGLPVAGLSTETYGSLRMDPMTVCSVHYADTLRDGSHKLAAIFNVEHPLIASAFEAGAPTVDFLRSMRELVGNKAFSAIALMDQRAYCKALQPSLRSEAGQDPLAEDDDPKDFAPGVTEAKLIDWLDWQNNLALEGQGMWDLDAILDAIRLDGKIAHAPKKNANSKAR